VPYVFGGRSLTEAGVYYDTVKTSRGCDSIVELTLTIKYPDVIFSSDTVEICQGRWYLFYGKSYTVAGTYLHYLHTNSCDSVFELVLIVNPAQEKPVITQNENVLTSSPAYTYQWSCDRIVINGATEQSYICTQNGTYYVGVYNEYGCYAKSDTISITNIDVGIAQWKIDNEQLKIFPNPTNGKLIIENGQLTMENGQLTMENTDYAIYSIVGQILMQGKLQGETTTLNVRH
jgi:hypothetical protein